MRLANITLNKVSRARKKVQLGADERTVHIMRRTVRFTRFLSVGYHRYPTLWSYRLVSVNAKELCIPHMYPLGTYFL